jgi:hypothetical protein
MNSPEIFNQLRTRLANAIAQRDHVPALDAIPTSPWLAMALLQKAIRRGRADLALRAAATLLIDAPDRLWRRVGGITFEDVGLGDLDAAGLVTASLAGKRLRASLGGEWGVASLLVTRMANAKKCRAADDLLMCAERHPAFAQRRRELAERSTRDLLRIAVGTSCIIERALALWYALGTDGRRSALIPRRGQPGAVFDYLCEVGFPHTVVEVAREGYRKTGEVLCALVALLSSEQRPTTPVVADDEFPPEEMIGEVPSWALDMYSREGRSALTHLIGGSSQTAAWVREHVAGPERVKFLGNVLFAVEGGLMTRRLRWPTGDRLRQLVDTECQSHCRDASEVLALMRADIPILNDIRRRLHGGLGHAN